MLRPTPPIPRRADEEESIHLGEGIVNSFCGNMINISDVYPRYSSGRYSIFDSSMSGGPEIDDRIVGSYY